MKLHKSLQQLTATLKRLFIVGALSFTLSQTASAATLDDVVKSIDNLRFYIESVVNVASKQLAEKLYEANPEMPAAIVGNQGQEVAKINLNNATYNTSLAQVKRSLSDSSEAQANSLARIPASDTLLASSSLPSLTGANKEMPDLAAGNANFDFETLFGATAYTPDRQTQAGNFIQIASGAYQPLFDFSLEGLTDKQVGELRRSGTYRSYQTALRSYIAGQSVSLDNIYYLFTERVVQPSLGVQAGLYGSNGQAIRDASPLQVREYLANRRTNSRQWYDNMAKASPATVARESLFVLAEIRQELFNMQMQNERLLATMSLMGTQLGSNNKVALQRLNQEVKDTITTLKGGVPASSNPAAALMPTGAIPTPPATP